MTEASHKLRDPVYVTIAMKGTEYMFRCMGMNFGKTGAWRLDTAVSAEPLPYIPLRSRVHGDSLAGLQHRVKAALQEKLGRKVTGVTEDVLDWPGKEIRW